MARQRSSAKRSSSSAQRRRGGFALTTGRSRGLREINHHAAGIDVGATQHFVAVPEGRDEEGSVRCFGTFTQDLQALADWLEQCGIQSVAMESTGVYWIPVFELLEARGFEVKLVEPSKLKNAPGRKTDVVDCQWIQQLHSYGLLQGSFRPEDAICQLRSFLRQRAMLVKYAAQHVQHMQKALMQMNVQLHHVISDITGETGTAIIQAILQGERDPHQLAALRDARCKNDEQTIALALEGNWRDDHLFALEQAWDLFRIYHDKMAELDERLEAYLKTFEDKSDGEVLPPRVRQRKRHSNEPKFDLRNYLHKMTGVDLTSIDGLGGHTVLTLISEIGTDMSAWPTEKHFASWLALCPGNHKTGGRQLRNKTKTRPSANRAATTLRLAAQSLLRASCALGAFCRRLRARLGPEKAITATAHKLGKTVYNMLRHGKPYVDPGADYYEKQHHDRLKRKLARQASALGMQLVPAPQPGIP